MTISSVLCFGGCTIDRFGRTTDEFARLYTSNIGVMRSSVGGAARNVAETLARLGRRVELVTAVGDDGEGRQILAHTAAAGVEVAHCRVLPGRRTASYTAILSGTGELVIGLADMEVLDALTAADADAAGDDPGRLLFLDANLPEITIAHVIARKTGPVAAGPVSVQKSSRLREHLAGLDYLFLNRFEAEALLGFGGKLPTLAADLAAGPVPHGVVTGGVEGAIAWSHRQTRRLAPCPCDPVNVNGAGDALAAATIAGLMEGADFFAAVDLAMAAAALTVEAPTAVASDISMAAIRARHARAAS
jgi:pseudouridine kinase